MEGILLSAEAFGSTLGYVGGLIGLLFAVILMFIGYIVDKKVRKRRSSLVKGPR